VLHEAVFLQVEVSVEVEYVPLLLLVHYHLFVELGVPLDVFEFPLLANDVFVFGFHDHDGVVECFNGALVPYKVLHFVYQKEHSQLSVQIGELLYFSELHALVDVYVVVDDTFDFDVGLAHGQ